jgi:hypothetical protein
VFAATGGFRIACPSSWCHSAQRHGNPQGQCDESGDTADETAESGRSATNPDEL